MFLDFHDPLTSMGPDLPGSLPRFDSGTDAVRALAAVTAHARWRERDPGAVPDLDLDGDRARRLINQVLRSAPDGRELSFVEATELARGRAPAQPSLAFEMSCTDDSGNQLLLCS